MSQFPLEKDGPTKNEKKVTNFELFLEFLPKDLCYKNVWNIFEILFYVIPLLLKKKKLPLFLPGQRVKSQMAHH